MDARSTTSTINNAFYDELGSQWVEAQDHPVALLRAENQLRNPWICQVLKENFCGPINVLDIGCGAGFLSHALAAEGHRVHGLDLSPSSIEVARSMDPSRSVQYQVGSAYQLPYPDRAFDAVCAMDLLEHVENPDQVVAEAARVLRPGGLFFFHTFNRTWLSWLVILKGVDWFVPQAIPQMHVYSLFITPKELKAYCSQKGLVTEQWRGVVPDWTQLGLWTMIFKRRIPKSFRFRFIRSLATGYSGYARLRTMAP